jgi:hypothetical protein
MATISLHTDIEDDIVGVSLGGVLSPIGPQTLRMGHRDDTPDDGVLVLTVRDGDNTIEIHMGAGDWERFAEAIKTSFYQ